MILKAGTYSWACAYCQEPSPEPVCGNCQKKLDEITARHAVSSRRGREIQRRITVYSNWPTRPEVTCSD